MRTYPHDEAVGVALFADGADVQLLSLEAYEIDIEIFAHALISVPGAAGSQFIFVLSGGHS